MVWILKKKKKKKKKKMGFAGVYLFLGFGGVYLFFFFFVYIKWDKGGIHFRDTCIFS